MPAAANPDEPARRRPLVSLNIDVANLPREAIERLLELAPQHGRVAAAYAFGDFRREDMDDIAVQLYQHGFRLVHCPAWPNLRGRLKSVVDDVMAQDLRDQLETSPHIDVYILGSGDRNFIAVANALKRHRKRVVVAADEESINRELRLCADEYIPLPRLRRGRPRPSSHTSPVQEMDYDMPDEDELLEQIRRLSESNEYLTVRRIVRAMLPDNLPGAERLRSELANRVETLVEAGRLHVDRRTIRGRVVNTLKIPEPPVEQPAQLPEETASPDVVAHKPPGSRRKSSVQDAS